jgi:carboxylesterase type B
MKIGDEKKMIALKGRSVGCRKVSMAMARPRAKRMRTRMMKRMKRKKKKKKKKKVNEIVSI